MSIPATPTFATGCVSIFVTDQPQCRVRVDGLQDEAELGLRRSGIQVSAEAFAAGLGVSIVTLGDGGCVAAANARLLTGVFLQSWILDELIPVWENRLTVFTSSSETAMNRQIRDFLRDEVVSVSNAILKARQELPQCANAANRWRATDRAGVSYADTINGRRLMWEECVEEMAARMAARVR